MPGNQSSDLKEFDTIMKGIKGKKHLNSEIEMK